MHEDLQGGTRSGRLGGGRSGVTIHPPFSHAQQQPQLYEEHCSLVRAGTFVQEASPLPFDERDPSTGVALVSPKDGDEDWMAYHHRRRNQ